MAAFRRLLGTLAGASASDGGLGALEDLCHGDAMKGPSEGGGAVEPRRPVAAVQSKRWGRPRSSGRERGGGKEERRRGERVLGGMASAEH